MARGMKNLLAVLGLWVHLLYQLVRLAPKLLEFKEGEVGSVIERKNSGHETCVQHAHQCGDHWKRADADLSFF